MYSNLITLKDDTWITRQKFAGRCVANILGKCGSAISSKSVSSLKDLESLADLLFKFSGCTPTFKGYRGFPSTMCVSVNKQLVHGICTDYILQDGDIVSVDVGATYEGAIADAARTWIYGSPKSEIHVELVEAGKKALTAGRKAIAVGKHIGAIGSAIHNFVKSTRFHVITEYGGHGLDYNKPHADPFVINKASSDEGIIMRNGLSIAVEPMLVIGDTATKITDDGWTVVCSDVSCHFEDSFTIYNNEVHWITEVLYE